MIPRLSCLFFFALTIEACATRATIQISSLEKTESIGNTFRLVATIDIGSDVAEIERFSPDGFYKLQLTSDRNLEAVVREKQMAFLYYKLSFCNSRDSHDEIYSDPALVRIDEKKPNGREPHHYYVFIPTNYTRLASLGSGNKDQINRLSEELATRVAGQELCIALGAGNMSGQYIRTNKVRLALSSLNG
jgi:hypothetical protein